MKWMYRFRKKMNLSVISCLSRTRCTSLPFGVLPFCLCGNIATNVQACWSCQLNLCLSAVNLWTVPEWAKRMSGHRTQVNGHEGSTYKNFGNLGRRAVFRPEPTCRCCKLCLTVPFCLHVLGALPLKFIVIWYTIIAFVIANITS